MSGKRKRRDVRKKRAGRKARITGQRYLTVVVAAVLGLIMITGIVMAVLAGRKKGDDRTITDGMEKYIAERPDLDVRLLTPNEYSRPQIALKKVKGVVVHYTANPGTTARQNRDYFEGLAKSKITKASSHFIIGLEGEIVQCIPCSEIAYASNSRNSDTIAIECCIRDESGKFGNETYASLIKLTTWLMGRYQLSSEDVIRHYDVTGKNCPKYFVEHPSTWEQFRKDLDSYIKKFGVVRGSKEDPAVAGTE